MAAQLSFYLKPVKSVRVNFKLALGSTLFIWELTFRVKEDDFYMQLILNKVDFKLKLNTTF